MHQKLPELLLGLSFPGRDCFRAARGGRMVFAIVHVFVLGKRIGLGRQQCVKCLDGFFVAD